MLDYTIVVPSRKRVHNMPTILDLLPSALICVDEREKNDYLEIVDESKLITHPAFDGAPKIRNWLLEEIKTKAIFFIADDFVGVKSTTGSNRFITDPEEILQIIENALIACDDLGLGVCCFSRTTNTTIINPDMRPIVPVQQVFSALGVMNSARYRKWETCLHGRADIDYTMQTLKEDRCVYADVRFYFDFGRIYSGRGGAVGLITTEQFMASSVRLKKKWGKYISFKGPSFSKNEGQVHCSINVTRYNKSGQR